MKYSAIIIILLLISCNGDPCSNLVCYNGGNHYLDQDNICHCKCPDCYFSNSCETKMNFLYDEEKIYDGFIDNLFGQLNVPYSITISNENVENACNSIITDSFGNQFVMNKSKNAPCYKAYSISNTIANINGKVGVVYACEYFQTDFNCNDADFCIFFNFTELTTNEFHQFVFVGDLQE